MMRIDCHQHLWPPEFVEALRARRAPPFLEGWTLHTSGEAPYRIDPSDHDAEIRRAREQRLGVDVAGISLSSPLGIEHLPAAEARKLIEAWHHSALALGDPFRVWAAPVLADYDTAGLRETLARDRVLGLQMPADAMLTPQAVAEAGPLLRAAEEAGKPVLVHPGVAPAEEGTLPSWWPAMVPYVSQMQAAWYSWHAGGRRAHPGLRIGFVALAGLAPMNHERLVARGGEFGQVDPQVYYETSSYAADAISAMAGVVGTGQIISGSDHPYAEIVDPALGEDFSRTSAGTALRRFLGWDSA